MKQESALALPGNRIHRQNKAVKIEKVEAEETAIRFLKQNDERFMLAIPWIGAAVTIGFWLLGCFGMQWPFNERLELLNGLIFLDHIHVVYNLPMLFAIPELHRWSKSQEVGSDSKWDNKLHPFFRIAVIGLALAAIFYVLQFSHIASLRGMATIFLLFELLGPDQHLVAQIRGISLIYNSTLRKSLGFSEAELQQAAKCERYERILFKFLLAGELLYWCPEIFEFDRFAIPGIANAKFVGGVLALMSASALILNSLYFPKQEKSRKSAFMTRVMLLPLKMLSPIGGLAVRAMHGTEYTIIMRKMVQNSELPKPKKWHAYALVIGVSLAYLVVYVLSYKDLLMEYTGLTISDVVYGGAFLTTFVVRFLHFYIDSLMFKMSDPATRKAMAPLLAK